MKQTIVYKDCQNVGEFLVIKQKHRVTWVKNQGLFLSYQFKHHKPQVGSLGRYYWRVHLKMYVRVDF